MDPSEKHSDIRQKTHQTAVVIIPPNAVWQPIQEIRRQYDRHYRRWMPHINLLYPFLPQEAFPELQPSFQNVCTNFPAFELTLSTIRFFRHRRGNYTLWLQPEPPEPLIRLQQKLLDIVPECADVSRHTGGYTPHLSIGQAAGKEALQQLLDELSPSWKPLAFSVDCIYFIRRDNPPNDIFQIAQRISLGT